MVSSSPLPSGERGGRRNARMPWLWLIPALLLAVAFALALRRLYRRGMDRWLIPYLVQAPKRRLPAAGEAIHVLLCFADHYEPKAGRAAPAVARARVERWVHDYPRQFARFRDSDGRP